MNRREDVMLMLSLLAFLSFVGAGCLSAWPGCLPGTVGDWAGFGAVCGCGAFLLAIGLLGES